MNVTSARSIAALTKSLKSTSDKKSVRDTSNELDSVSATWQTPRKSDRINGVSLKGDLPPLAPSIPKGNKKSTSGSATSKPVTKNVI